MEDSLEFRKKLDLYERSLSFNIFFNLLKNLWFLENLLHGILIKEIWYSPQNSSIPAWSLSESLPCLLLQPGLKHLIVTSEQWWCHCYIYRELLWSVFQPGLWVFGMTCLVIQTCSWKKFGMSPNTTWLLYWRGKNMYSLLSNESSGTLDKCGPKIPSVRNVFAVLLPIFQVNGALENRTYFFK